ncbi:MAG: triose-phosphate isomerase, partial [Eubacteriales bacterium]|nr:triose-phosphate isomerase [Eubacteriales bacterium]
MRKPIIAGNWKMNKTAGETKQLISELIPLVKDVKDVEIVVCPPFVSIETAAEA